MTLAEQLLIAYGGLGGWLGIAFAVYLHRVRPVQYNPASVLAIFALGFSMLTTTVMLADFYATQVAMFTLVFVAYTLMILAELALFGHDAQLRFVRDVREWLAEPRFVHEERIESTPPHHDQARTTRSQSHAKRHDRD